MSNTVFTATYHSLPFCEKEILRYAGAPCAEGSEDLLAECIAEAKAVIQYSVCYCFTNVTTDNGVCSFDAFSLYSKDLSKSLEGCTAAVIFAATLGTGLDRLIAKYSRISPAKALMLQAIGAQQTETLCDAFCRDIAEKENADVTRRFSAGYGDLPLEIQKQIFALLNCPKHIGLTLNDSLLMSPTKSVTAFFGLY